MALLESSHDLTQRDRLGRPRQAETAAGAALGADKAALSEVAHHFGEVVAGNAELSRDLVGRERAVWLPGQPHQCA